MPRNTLRPIRVLLPHRLFGNIYVRELGRAYQAEGAEVVYGPENLFESRLPADIFHLHWPEDLYRGYGDAPPREQLDTLTDLLDAHRDAGGRIAWTIHNLVPHEHADNAVDLAAYQAFAERADLIVHHCERSRELLSDSYRLPDRQQSLVSPHGHYGAYPDDTDRKTARERLGIDSNAVVFVHFGNLRGYKGIDGVFEAFDALRLKNKFLVVAGQYTRGPGIRGRLYNLRLTAMERFGRNRLLRLGAIAQNEIQWYLNAADALVLGHRRGLNSGVAVLGMTFGKLVIGPDIGCVGSVLRQGHNIVYPAGDYAALTRAMATVPDLDLQQVADANRDAAARWDWRNTARDVLNRLGRSTAAGHADATLNPHFEGSA